MKRPRFKLDGGQATLRYTDMRGKRRVAGDRASRMLARVAEQIVAGTGKDFEMRKATTKWHPVEMTLPEAREYLASHWMLKSTLRRAERVRERRLASGKTVL